MQREPSITAYHNIVLPKIGNRQRAVFDVLKKNGSLTNSEIAKFIGVEINQITPRTNELVKMNLVEDAGKRLCTAKKSNIMVHAWRIKTQITPVFKNPSQEVEIFNNPRQLSFA